MQKNTIAFSNFVRRQTPNSQFSHWTISDEEVLGRVHANFGHAKPGYRDGVLLVPVTPEGFYANTVQMKEGDIIVGIYKPRQKGEEPRRQTFILGGRKLPAKRVDVVLYRHDVLAENNEHSCDSDWEIISVNAEKDCMDSPSPLRPSTLMANHFRQSGGTATGMTPEQFQEAMAVSLSYWKDKGDAAPATLVDVPEGASVAQQQMASEINALYARLADVVSRYNYYQED